MSIDQIIVPDDVQNFRSSDRIGISVGLYASGSFSLIIHFRGNDAVTQREEECDNCVALLLRFHNTP